MNIIKIKEGFAEDYAQYNDMYCYFINWKWIVPFEVITQQEYIEISQKDDITCLGREIPYLDYTKKSFSSAFASSFASINIENIIDWRATYNANSIAKFIEFNKFSASDNPLDFNTVRRFRTWLSEELFSLLKYETFTPKDVLQMLKYYSDDMSDNVIKGLYLVSDNNLITINSTNYSSCGCKSTDNQSVLNPIISMCDPIKEYRKSIYNIMVKTFSDIEFWEKRDPDLLQGINKYLDYIIKKNLPLSQCEFAIDLYDCSCLSDKDYKQNKYIEILKNLITSFEYIINKDVNQHKNFIGQSLNNWAVYLYEKMRW
jgi:hypothetical protein